MARWTDRKTDEWMDRQMADNRKAHLNLQFRLAKKADWPQCCPLFLLFADFRDIDGNHVTHIIQ